MDIFATPGLPAARTLFALTMAIFAAGCTHEYQITPRFQRSFAQLPDRPVCARGESLAVSVTNPSPQPLDAGQVTGGIHTFNHHFARDPALVLAEGLKEALQDGHCSTASPGAAELQVVVVRMAAHGEACGFVSCDGVAEAAVSIKVLDPAGHVLAEQEIAASAKDGCGMSFCSDEETSDLSTKAISEAVGKMVAVIGDALARRPAGPPAAAPSPGS